MNSFLHLMPLFLVSLGGVVLMLLSAIGKFSTKHYIYMCVAFLALAEAFQVLHVWQLYSIDLYPQIFNGMIIADSYSSYFNAILIMGAILILLISEHYFAMQKHFRGEFFSIMLFSVFAMMMLVQSTELISAFIALEIASLCVYIMIGFQKDHHKRIEASYKYLVVGSISGAIFLLGVGLIYAGLQTTHLGELAHQIQYKENLNLVIVGASMILIMFLFKISAFPFQSWAIDVYDGAPLPVTGYMAAAFKISIFGFMLRAMLVDFEDIKGIWTNMLIFITIATLVYGSFLALIQKSVKRMLAASSIVHTGYLLIAFISTTTMPEEASSSLIFYQVAYFLSSVGAFGLISYIVSDDKLRITYNDFKGFAKTEPTMAASMSVFMLSLAGIPSTIGFMGKFYIFSGAISAGYSYLSIVAIIATGISIYYYFKLIAVMYFYPPSDGASVPMLRGITPKIIGLLALATIWGGVGNIIITYFPDVDFIIDLAQIAYKSLFL
ncbi:MAG: NADH-quinone oxidoreductase subunit N [Proteobacteria bacterium]|nr:MAG: NADH-quinone oxidoreductase subunit N [Pseudomonadota bacterium]